MQITDVRVFPVRDDKLKAFVSVVFESCFMVNDIKVINGRDGYFISMPSRRKKNGEFKDIAHPLNTDTRRLLEERILDEYEQVVALETRPVRRYENDNPARESAGGCQSRSASDQPAAAATPTDEPRHDATRPSDREQGSSADFAEPAGTQAEPGDRSDQTAPADASASDGDRERRDLDDVVEDHLSDAFWS